MSSTIEFDDFMDGLTENSTPTDTAKLITKEAITTAQYTGKGDIAIEGTKILSTGESGASKYLREDGDGSSSWQDLPSTSLPIGYIFMQLPGKDTPAELGLVGTWTDVSSTFAGNFFRVAGGNASAFESGTQDDAMQGHWHTQYMRGAAGTGSTDGVIANTAHTKNSSLTQSIREPLSDGVNGTPRTDDETRPTNETIKVWERTS